MRTKEQLINDLQCHEHDDGWAYIVTKDLINNTQGFIEESEKGKGAKCRGLKISKDELIKHGDKFSMFDDDDNCYFQGYTIGGDGFKVLDNLGSGYGCTYVKINGEVL